MFKAIEPILWEFRSCFSRKAAFSWFLIIMVGLLVRFDHFGISSFIRWLFLNPEYYDPMLRFFRATSWNLEVVLARWTTIAITRYPTIEFNGRKVLIGDGIKVSKESQKMPGVKSLYQDSENSGKPEYIHGHHFGFVGLLVGSLTKAFCLPLQGQLHEGVEDIRPGKPFAGKPATLITRMAHLVVEKAKQTGCLCYSALDAYFSVGPMFQICKEAVNEQGQQWVHVITRAKDNYVAYMYDESPQKKFDEKKKVNLWSVFGCPELFEKAELTVYGKVKTIQYYYTDLLWRPINDFLRFVWIIDGEDRYILMCSDLLLPATQIITIYSYRSKVETMFLVLKHLIGAFCYHFWTKSFPKTKRGQSLNYSNLKPSERQKFDQAIEAIERFVNLAAIALGLLQYLALTHSGQIWEKYQGWLRTYSAEIPSEGVVQSVLRVELFSSLGKVPSCGTLQVIQERAREAPEKEAA